MTSLYETIFKAKAEAPSLQVLFSDPTLPSMPALTTILRDCDPTMNAAHVETTPSSPNGFATAVARWGSHAVRAISVQAPMPEPAVNRSTLNQSESMRAVAWEHRAFVELSYVGRDPSPVEQYVALAAVASALVKLGGTLVANEGARTSLPAAALVNERLPGLEAFRAMPLVLLFSGFGTFDIEGANGVWMRSFGNHLLHLPDLAYLAAGHHEAQRICYMMDDIMRHLLSSGRALAPGHTMDVGWTTMRTRLPEAQEYYLESQGAMLVLESVPGAMRS